MSAANVLVTFDPVRWRSTNEGDSGPHIVGTVEEHTGDEFGDYSWKCTCLSGSVLREASGHADTYESAAGQCQRAARALRELAVIEGGQP